jgi:hypothetical protein
MERSLKLIDGVLDIVGSPNQIPCDTLGRPAAA